MSSIHHHKERSDTQIEILYKLATRGNQTISKLSKIPLNKHRTNFVKSIRILENLKMVARVGNLTGVRGMETFYKITETGIDVLFNDKEMTSEQFWEIMFILSSANKNKTSFQYEHFFRNYEERILNIKLKNVPTLWGNSVKNPSEIYQDPLTFNLKLLVLYFLGINGPLSFKGIIKKYRKKTKSSPNKITEINENLLESMVNEKILLNKVKFQISAAGLVLLLTNFNTVHEGEADLKKILKNSCDIIPYFSKLCEKIPAIVKDTSILNYFREIFNQLTNTVAPIQHQGTKELIILERVMEEVNRTKIWHESNIGHHVRAKLIQEKKIQDIDSPIQDKLNYLARISGYKIENTDEDSEKAINNKIDLEIEKAISNKIDFELFCHFLPNMQDWIKTDQNFQKQGEKDNFVRKKLHAWEQFRIENLGFRDWFNSWIDDITNFEKENLRIINKIKL